MASQRTEIETKATAISAGGTSRPVKAQESDSSSIAVLAFNPWLARGCPEGSPEIDWFEAEQLLDTQPVQSHSPSTMRLLPTRPVGA
jgi:hypothetical protein